MDPRLEVAVARKHGRTDEIVLDDGPLDIVVEGTGVADAGGAAIGGNGESQLLQEREQAGLLEISRHDA